MTQEDFLLQYGNEEVYFISIRKNRITMRNDNYGIFVMGTVSYTSDIDSIETIKSFYNEIFNFDFSIKTS